MARESASAKPMDGMGDGTCDDMCETVDPDCIEDTGNPEEGAAKACGQPEFNQWPFCLATYLVESIADLPMKLTGSPKVDEYSPYSPVRPPPHRDPQNGFLTASQMWGKKRPPATFFGRVATEATTKESSFRSNNRSNGICPTNCWSSRPRRSSQTQPVIPIYMSNRQERRASALLQTMNHASHKSFTPWRRNLAETLGRVPFMKKHRQPDISRNRQLRVEGPSLSIAWGKNRD